MFFKPATALNHYTIAFLCALSFSIAACKGQGEGQGEHQGQHQGEHADKPVADAALTLPIMTNETVLNSKTGLTVSNAYVKPPLPGRDISAIYFTLSSGTQADRLTGVRTSLSEHAEIHTHIKDGDIMKMRRIEMLELKRGATIPFKPGGYHIMVFGTELSPVATDAEMTLIFEKAGEAVLTVPIQGRIRQAYQSSDEPTQNPSPENGSKDTSHR